MRSLLVTPLIPLFLTGCQMLVPDTWPEHSAEREAMRQHHLETRRQTVAELSSEQSAERAALRQQQAAEVAVKAAKTAAEVKKARKELKESREALIKALTD